MPKPKQSDHVARVLRRANRLAREYKLGYHERDRDLALSLAVRGEGMKQGDDACKRAGVPLPKMYPSFMDMHVPLCERHRA